MERKIIFSNVLKQQLDRVSYTEDIWTNNGINNSEDLMKRIIDILNEKYIKLNIIHYEFRENVEMYGESNTFFGIIENENEKEEGYLFIIPPDYSTRSGVLAQQVFPVISGIIPRLKDSNDRTITNRPIYIINANQVNQTPGIIINILSGMILGFFYVDIFNRQLDEILKEKGFKDRISNIEDYDEWLVQVNKGNENEYFKLDKENKTIQYLTLRLKDGVHVTNEPYWFVLKGYASFYLAIRDGYKCDMTIFNELPRGNKTLDAFRDYVESFI